MQQQQQNDCFVITNATPTSQHDVAENYVTIDTNLMQQRQLYVATFAIHDHLQTNARANIYHSYQIGQVYLCNL